MGYRDLVKKIPASMYEKLSEKFIDALLEAKEGGKVPSSVAKTILHHSMEDKLASEVGLQNLLEALALADRQRAVELLEESGLKESTQALNLSKR